MHKFLKFFYWVKSDNLQIIKDKICDHLAISKIPCARERQCESLQSSRKIMHVPPEVWSCKCFRQGSWFRNSDFAKYHLLVSNSELNPDLFCESFVLSGQISCIELEKKPSLSQEEYLALIQTKEFQEQAPEEWFHLLPHEIPLFQAYLANRNINLSLTDFLAMHSANHANFLLSPENLRQKGCFVELNHKIIPCSLFSQTYSCSACLELFGVIGRHHPQTIIKKCPGLKYVNLFDNEYLFTAFETLQ